MYHVIEDAALESGLRLRLRFADGLSGTLDSAELIAQGGVFTALEDPNVREQVMIGERGRYLEWPGEIDLCADALWLQIKSDSH